MLTKDHIARAHGRMVELYRQAEAQNEVPSIQYLVTALGLDNAEMQGFVAFLMRQFDVSLAPGYQTYFEGFLTGVVASRMEMADGDTTEKS